MVIWLDRVHRNTNRKLFKRGVSVNSLLFEVYSLYLGSWVSAAIFWIPSTHFSRLPGTWQGEKSSFSVGSKPPKEGVFGSVFSSSVKHMYLQIFSFFYEKSKLFPRSKLNSSLWLFASLVPSLTASSFGAACTEVAQQPSENLNPWVGMETSSWQSPGASFDRVFCLVGASLPTVRKCEQL